jgi:hypothetical protein
MHSYRQTMRYLLIGPAALLATMFLTERPYAPASVRRPISVSMNAGAWWFLYSPTMPAHPSAHPDFWSFDFPAQDGVHYLVQPVSGYASSTVRVTFRIETTGSPFFDWRTAPNNICDNPASVRLYLQRRGDDMSAAKEFFRWWSNPVAYTLAPGAGELVVPLDPAQWSSVLGKKGTDSAAARLGFEAALADLGNVGMTFGGGCYYGHGVFVTGGTARFIATEYEVR